MDSKTYERYVEIDCWRVRRLRYLKGHPWCEICGIVANDTPIQQEAHEEAIAVILEIHHLSYAHLGNEPDEDLVTLCPLCHSMVHGLMPRNYVQLAIATLEAANALLALPKRTKLLEILKAAKGDVS